MKDIYPCLWFDNQAEEAAAGGATQSCGRLKDKYGLSWQIVQNGTARADAR